MSFVWGVVRVWLVVWERKLKGLNKGEDWRLKSSRMEVRRGDEMLEMKGTRVAMRIV